MFGKWFKKSDPLRDADAETRRAAVQALTETEVADPQMQTQLADLAVRDDQVSVRRAAIAQLTTPGVLIDLLDSEELAANSAQRLAALIGSGQCEQSLLHKPAVLQAYLPHASDADIQALMADLNDPEQLAAIAVRARPELRDAALQHASLISLEGLQVLERQSRGHSKVCNRHAREKLALIKSTQKQYLELLDRVKDLDSTIARDMAVTQESDHARHTTTLKIDKLLTMRRTSAEQAQALLATWQTTGQADLPALPPEPDGVLATQADPSSEPSATDEAQTKFPDLLRQLNDIAATPLAGRETPDLQTLLASFDALDHQWLQLAINSTPDAVSHSAYQRVQRWAGPLRRSTDVLNSADWQDLKVPDTQASIQHRRGWHKQWQARLKSLAWPDGMDLPAPLQRLHDALADNQAHIAASQQNLDEQQHALKTALKEVDTAIDAGNSKQAVSAIKQARKLFSALPGDSRTEDFERSLTSLSARLAELQDWQKFATAPKREELLNALGAIAETPLPAPDQAARLREMRQAWQQLGRPASSEEHQQQQKFDALADQAYEPCKAYFDDQARIREDNLANRQALCDQLQHYLNTTDWDHADMTAAEQIMRTAREEWRRFHPCDRRALKPVEKNFESLQQQLYEQVKRSWDLNVAAKQQIVAEAEALLQLEDSQAQANGAKALQQRWREIGTTPRAADQKLWKMFRGHCDAIFAQRQAAHEARLEEHSAALDGLRASIGALESAVEAGRGGGEISPKALDALNSPIEEALNNGVRAPADLISRLRQARQAYESILQDQRAAEQVRKIDDWAQWDLEVSRAEQTESAIEAPHNAFRARLAGETAPLDWQKLALEAEIAADLPSPEEDQNARMALQIELMNAGVRNLQAGDALALMRRWCEAGPKDSSADPYRDRFFSAIKARLSS